MSFLLAIDVGNTQITLGAYRGDRLVHTWRLRTERHATADELGVALLGILRAAAIDVSQLLGIIIASVVPPIDGALTEACARYLRQNPLIVGPKTKLGIKNRYKRPEEVGADRLVNAVAAYAVVRTSAIVVDFGTATTFDCIGAHGDYLGGVIAPGLESATEALVLKTAKLPRVSFQVPERALGRTTVESLQSGLFWGYISLVEGMLKRLTQEMKTRPKLIATGGLSPVIGPRIRPLPLILPNLTLDGLCQIWHAQKTPRKKPL